MSWIELYNNGSSHPGANLRIESLLIDENLTVDGTTIYNGGVTFSGPVTYNGLLTANDGITVASGSLIASGEVVTNSIISGVPNSAIVVLPNGLGDYFDITTDAGLRVNSIISHTSENLVLSAASGQSIEIENNIIPNTSDALNIGSGSALIANVYSAIISTNNLTTESGSNISLANGINIVAGTDGGSTLGATGNGFSAVWTNEITSDSSNIYVGVNLVPYTVGSQTLGASGGTNWGNVYTNGLTLSKGSFSQLTSPTTSVATTGTAFQITTQSFTTATTATDTFAVTNVAILSSSYIDANILSYSGIPLTDGIPSIGISSVTAGSFNVNISNNGLNALSGTFILQFFIF